MPTSDERQEFFKDFQGRKAQRADQLRSKVAKAKATPTAKAAPSASDAELKRLRRENEVLRANAMKARSEAASILSRANRMSQVPPHVVKDFATQIIRILGG